MLRVGRNEDVPADVDAGARAFLERDDGQRLRKWLSTCSPSVADCPEMPLRISVDGTGHCRCCRSARVRPTRQPLRQRRTPGGSRDRHSSQGRSSQRVKPDVLVEVERETIRAHGTMEGHEHLPLLGVADTLHVPNEPRSLRHEELLVVVRVVVRREHDEDRPTQAAVDVIRHDSLKTVPSNTR
jgi:hypothetical protein